MESSKKENIFVEELGAFGRVGWGACGRSLDDIKY